MNIAALCTPATTPVRRKSSPPDREAFELNTSATQVNAQNRGANLGANRGHLSISRNFPTPAKTGLPPQASTPLREKPRALGTPGFHPIARTPRALGTPGFHPIARTPRALGTPGLNGAPSVPAQA